MPGHMGDRVVTTPAMEVIRVDAVQNLLLIKGSVPGSDETIVLIHRSWKGPKRVHVQQVKKRAAVQPSGGAKASAAKPGAAKPAAAKSAAAKPAAGGKK